MPVGSGLREAWRGGGSLYRRRASTSAKTRDGQWLSVSLPLSGTVEASWRWPRGYRARRTAVPSPLLARKEGLAGRAQEPEWEDKLEGGAQRVNLKETLQKKNLVRKISRFPRDRQQIPSNSKHKPNGSEGRIRGGRDGHKNIWQWTMKGFWSRTQRCPLPQPRLKSA